MGILLVLLSAQEPESVEDLVQILQQFQSVWEMESEAASETAAAVAAARLDRPSTRRALWQALTDPNLTPETRLLVIQALQQLGELSGFMETVAALAQFGAGDAAETVPGRERTVRERTQTTIQTVPAGRTRNLAPPAPPPADDKTARRNTVLGIASLCVVALLLLLRKGR